MLRRSGTRQSLKIRRSARWCVSVPRDTLFKACIEIAYSSRGGFVANKRITVVCRDIRVPQKPNEI